MQPPAGVSFREQCGSLIRVFQNMGHDLVTPSFTYISNDNYRPCHCGGGQVIRILAPETECKGRLGIQEELFCVRSIEYGILFHTATN